ALAAPALYAPSLHDALPICPAGRYRDCLREAGLRAVPGLGEQRPLAEAAGSGRAAAAPAVGFDFDQGSGLRRAAVCGSADRPRQDRKSTRLNSSHVKISYAV